MLQTLSDEAKDEDPETDDSEVSSPVPSPAISLLSPKAMEITGRIIKIEKEYREKAQVSHSVLILPPAVYPVIWLLCVYERCNNPDMQVIVILNLSLRWRSDSDRRCRRSLWPSW